MEGRSRSMALNADEAVMTQLGRGAAQMREGQGDLSGFYSLHDPLDAFAARMLLAQFAEKTLDVQYYIWRGDRSGVLLLEALLDAAERGVRVRLLLDDNGTSGLDDVLSALDSHERVEVRLFNPFVVRRPKALGFLTDFSRANRRMHNKSMTADNSVTIVGGRNVGDEYFAAYDDDEVLFADLDVMAIGPVVEQTSKQFDDYWASASSYPVSLILQPAGERERTELHARSDLVEQDPGAAKYLERVTRIPFLQDLFNGTLELEWAPARMVVDAPSKGLANAADRDLMLAQIEDLFIHAEQNLDLVSPYFVPTQDGVDMLIALRARGVKVRVLTNALEATDVAAVHSGYAKYRKPLLAAGVELFEKGLEPGEARKKERAGFLGSSGSSLHAKTFAVDGEQFYVGSFNFDPRSALLNTEMGFVIDSPNLAGQLKTVFDEGLTDEAYQLGLDERGDLYWLDRSQSPEQRFDTEPGVGFFRRMGVKVLGWLPIESLL